MKEHVNDSGSNTEAMKLLRAETEPSTDAPLSKFHTLFRQSKKHNALCGTNFRFYIRDLVWRLPLNGCILGIHCRRKQAAEIQLWCPPNNRSAQQIKHMLQHQQQQQQQQNA
jgi:hypothetical protein